MNGLLTEYRLTFADDIRLKTTDALKNAIADIIESDDFGKLTILFASEGGDIYLTAPMFNFISQLPTEVYMHATGHVGSAAFPIFLAGRKRSCSRYAQFFIHEYFWQPNPGEYKIREVKEELAQIEAHVDVAKNIIEDRTSIPKEYLCAIDGSIPCKIFLPDQAMSFGIVSEICELENDGSRDMKVKQRTVGA
jgi:ATP-dependent protease ClpP protease subunit